MTTELHGFTKSKLRKNASLIGGAKNLNVDESISYISAIARKLLSNVWVVIVSFKVIDNIRLSVFFKQENSHLVREIRFLSKDRKIWFLLF